MRRSLKVQSAVITIFALIIVGMVIGCGSEEKLETQMSGSWQRTQGDGTLVIDLEKVDMGTDSVHLKVTTESGTSEEWILHQVWDDNGSTFKLAFRHNGTQETLVPAGGS